MRSAWRRWHNDSVPHDDSPGAAPEMTPREWTGLEIAIVGMAGRFPGAADIDAFWRNLDDGVEAIRRLSPDELVAAGRSAAEVADPAFVPAHGVLDGHDQFDADFFGYRKAEADCMDPQQRVFLELAWQALENAAVDPRRYPGAIAVFAGSSADHYLYEHVLRNPAALERSGHFVAQYSNQPDHLATRVAYKLDLRGAAVAVQSACSTSLVAVHLACTHLLAGSCDLALAGGVSLTLPRFWGYRHEEGMILSPDGHCRAFDQQAAGTLKGDGAGIVVLKRLADALADGDRIEAVILASAINNDGAAKVGYTAPGLDGQASLIEGVHAAAGVPADSIGYIECHGTGTPLGDPIEVGALTRAFGQAGTRRGACGLGSVKTGIGHLDAAAGVAGLIKAALALRHARLPASLNFSAPNPQLRLGESPFYVVDRSRDWPPGAGPRRAGVSSFGIGGTNAHVLLEEPPPATPSPPVAGPQLLLLSARTGPALAAMAQQLAAHLQACPGLSLHDLAQTLARGRQPLAERRAVVAHDIDSAIEALARPAAALAGRAADSAPPVVFMFPGQGAQYAGMARGLYETTAVFRSELDACCETLLPLLGLDLREVLFDASEAAADRLQQTAITQPALFAVGYSMAVWLIDLGIRPAAVIGHSVGEIVAACVAGVFSRDEALRLVAARGRLMQAQPPGAMLAVSLDAAELQPELGPQLGLAADNAPGMSVASGPQPAIEELAARLAGRGVDCTPLRTSHAFHSAMMDGAVEPYREVLAGLRPQPPRVRLASTASGGWAEADRLRDPQHWVDNLRREVRFGPAMKALFELGDPVLLEVGPGTTLCGLARRQKDRPAGLVAASTLRHPKDEVADADHALALLGKLWCAGVGIGDRWLGGSAWRRLALPGYPFQRQRHWIDPAPAAAGAPAATAAGGLRAYHPRWARRPARRPPWPAQGWALVGEGPDLDTCRALLQASGVAARTVPAANPADWAEAWSRVIAEGAPQRLLVLAPADAARALDAVAVLLQAIAAHPPPGPLHLTLASRGAFAVLGDEAAEPRQALAWGWLQVAPTEIPDLGTSGIDLPPGETEAGHSAGLRAALDEAAAADTGAALAWRRGQLWQRSLMPAPADPPRPALPRRLRPGGVYAISGGLGGVGLVLAEYLARTVQAKLLLFGRTPVPARERWARLEQTDPAWPVVQRLQAVEAAGGTLMLAQADVADSSALRALLERVTAQWGPLHGLIHAAGVPGGGAIALQRPENLAAVLAPKVHGTDALLATFGEQVLDFVLLCSSLTSFVALRGRSEYTAANLYLDAVAQARAGARGPITLALNWDNWREIGMARSAAGGAEITGLSNAEALAAFARVLDDDEPQWVLAARDLHAPPAAVPAAIPAPAQAPTSDATPASAAAPQAATSVIEQQLLDILRDLLDAPQMGPQDDFFSFGGDSVVSIQLVARARRRGLAMGPRQVFELRTAAAMAAAIEQAGPPSAVPADAGNPAATPAAAAVTTPIQRWFFSLPLPQRGSWNLVLELGLPTAAAVEALFEGARHLAAGLDVLTLRFADDGRLLPANGSPVEVEAIDLGDVSDAVLAEELPALRQRAGRAFDLALGPLMRLQFVGRATRAERLFISAHHLVSDLIGLRAFADDLADAWQCRAEGRPLPPVEPFSWARWSARLHALAQTPEVKATLAHWTQMGRPSAAALPRDSAAAANLERGADSLRLGRPLPVGPDGTDLAARLLAALGQALLRWSGQTSLWIDVEGHGRDDAEAGADRALGWFTTLFPVRIDARDAPAPAVAAAAAALRDAPYGGAGFGWLRWLNDEPALRAELAALPRPEVVFLYQGRRRAAPHPVMPTLGLHAAHDPAGPRSHVFEINAWVEEGKLQLEWGFNRELHAPATVERLLAAVADEWRRQGQPHAAGPAPVVEAPLSLAQERLWFLEALEPDATLFNKQAAIELEGPLDVAALQTALGDLAARHAALRTRFTMRDGLPLQCVDPWALPPLPLSACQDPAAAERLARERASRRFDLAAEPPYEARLLQLAPQRHWLLLTIHHIIADAWSFQVLQRDLARLYGARLRGRSDPTPQPPLTLADHARRQRERLSGPVLQALLDYWKPRLSGLSPLELPADRPRPPVQRFDGARVALRWPAALTAAFRRLTREQGASPFMGLLALYKLLLRRHSGQSDIVVGCSAADRPEVDTEDLVGPLVNNLVLRTSVDADLDFVALLARVRDIAIGAFEQRDLPFEKLVEALNPVRDRSRAPLFQAMFAYMNVPGSLPAWDGLEARARELSAGGSEFDLSLYAYDPGDAPGACFTGWFEYATALFDAATIERLAGHLQQLAESACAEPARRVALLPILTPAERRTILVDWNRTGRDYPPLDGVHRLFERQAARTPDAPAVVAADGTLSYAELDRRSNRLARLLQARGVAANSRVVLCTDRGSAMMVGLMGVLKSGGAYVPVDPSYPAERIAGMVDDCGATVVLTQERWLPILPVADPICLDRDGALYEGLDDAPLPSAAGPDRLAYLIYTSGSTGRPKGVCLPHGAVLNFLHSMIEQPGLDAGDVLVAVTTLSFDIAVLELFGPLAVGARVVLASREQTLDGHALRALLESSGATMMQATPSSWRMLVDAGWRGSNRFNALIGGEALPPDLAQALLQRCASLWNLYGPTETTVWSSCWRVESPERGVRIGRPIANTQIYILDEAGEICPIGAVGEIHIGGAGVALGYHDQPALTAQRFVPDPFSGQPGARLYRTGDRGRWRNDGQLEHLGRLDHQVKLRGHRVELGEIEVVVGRHPAVALCVAEVREDDPGDQRLVVYAVPEGDERPAVAELRRWAAAQLPAFMLPAAVVWLDALPQTPNGKVNRAALPVPRSAAAPVEDLPLNLAEQRIAEVFAEVLGSGPVRRYDNFFDLGGHSLLVMKVVDRLRRSAGIELHPGELFQQTVGQIALHHAALLGVGSGTAVAAAAPERAPDGVEAFFFAGTAGQLYACLHRPPSSPLPGSTVRALLLCAPTGHEYTRCHRALKQLATLAAAAGWSVLRFDYHGSGDAEGDEAAFSLSQARADIGSAVDELRRRSGAVRVDLLGLRLGATLALQVACGRDDIGSAVLWAPVWDGAELLADWRAQQKAFVEALGYADDGATQEVLGAPLPRELADEIATLHPAECTAVAPGPARLLTIGAAPPPGWLNGLGARPVATIGRDAAAAIWRQEPLQAIVPQALLRRIVDWLGKGS